MQVVEQVGSALETFKRNRMLDAITWDDDKLTPVYKMDEICDFVDSANIDVIKDIQEYLIRRLDHKSPWVKQKVLRLIKYMSGKAGHVWKREMQRHSSSIRPLFHYTGTPDPLRGDAPNKAVRELAHEAVTAIFAQEEKKSSAPDNSNKRIQGFGSGGEGGGSDSLGSGKSFGSGSRAGISVMGFGSGSFGSSLGSLGGSFSGGASRGGSKGFRGPSSRRPLNADGGHDNSKDGAADSASSYRGVEVPRDTAPGVSGNGSSSRQWGQITSNRQLEEDKLVEELTTPGGVRVQPTKDQLQSFVASVAKLDPVGVATALEGKLQAENWQVRLRALCAIESVMRNTNTRPAEILFNFFYEDSSAIVDCLSMSQASVRDKAKKLLELLGQEEEQQGDGHGSQAQQPGKAANGGSSSAPLPVEMPDLLDTSEPEPSSGGGQGAFDLLGKDLAGAGDRAPVGGGDLLGEGVWGASSSGMNPSGPTPVPTASTSAGQLASDPTAETEDIFAGLTINNPASPSELAGPSNGTSSNGDLFAGMQVNGNLGSNGMGNGMGPGYGRAGNNAPMSPSAAQGSDLFEGLQINEAAGRGAGGGGGFFSPPTSPLRAAAAQPMAAGQLGAGASLADLVGPLSSLDSSGQPGGAAADVGPAGKPGAKPMVDPLQAYNAAPAGAPAFPGVMPGAGVMPPAGGAAQVPGGPMQVPMMAMPMMGGMVPQQFVYIPNGQGGYLPQMVPAMAMPGFYPGGPMLGAGRGAGGYAFMPQMGGLGPAGGFAALQRSGSLGNGAGSAYSDGFDFSGDPTIRLPTQAGPEVKEQVKAFDFVSEHLSAARAPSKKPLRS